MMELDLKCMEYSVERSSFELVPSFTRRSPTIQAKELQDFSLCFICDRKSCT